MELLDQIEMRPPPLCLALLHNAGAIGHWQSASKSLTPATSAIVAASRVSVIFRFVVAAVASEYPVL